MSTPDTVLATPAISKFLRTKKLQTDGSRKMTPKASLSSMRFWSELDRAPNHPCQAADRGLGDPVEFVASIILPTEGRHEVSLAIGIGIGIRNQNSPF